MIEPYSVQRLVDAAPELERILTRGVEPPPRFAVSDIRCETVKVAMRDGVRLATDLYLPPAHPAPAIAMRTPYGRAVDRFVGTFLALARRGYVVISQDCRGTGDSEPDHWDYYVYEREDGFDFVEWVSKQKWFDGFLGACGGSYVGQTQWCMATHRGMSTIIPEVSGLGVAVNTVHLYMFLNAVERSVGKGEGKFAVHYSEMERLIEAETMAGGYFNESLHEPYSASLLAHYPVLNTLPPSQEKRYLWEQYCALGPAQRAELIKQAMGVNAVTATAIESSSALFGHKVSHDAHTIPHPSQPELCRLIHAPVLFHTGWYDWALNDALATWELFRREAREPIASRSRLIITPSAHNMPGYHEGIERHPELQHNHRTSNNVGLMLRWYEAVREEQTGTWPTVIYYLMGANEWWAAPDWPVCVAQQMAFHLCRGETLKTRPARRRSLPDRYIYDPKNPTPTVGGSIVSYIYPPGSVDVSAIQKRPDVLVYTTAPLERDLDVVGPLRLILYASSSAVDTDFCARLSDVFPDGRAIEIQSGMLRARYRNLEEEPELLEAGRIYRFEIDMWATANRFRAGHCLRLDISSSNFPRFDRNVNRGGKPGKPVPAQQTVYHDLERPSHLLVSVLGRDLVQG